MDNLRALVDEVQRKAHTKRLDISLNEMADMHNSGELEIQPSFQRNFVWEKSQQSRFVESLLLDLPTPPFYIVEHETKEGQYELIDGLQRLSSYLHFRGELDNQEIEEPISKGQLLKLEECEIVPELDGHTWDTIPSGLKFKLKRTFISVQVIQRASDRELKYHLFKRLNAGGTKLSEQQIRNCTVRMLGSQFLDFIEECSKIDSYMHCIEPLTDDDRTRQEQEALVLRYFAFKNDFAKFKHDVNPFLDTYLEGVTRYLADIPSTTERVIPFDVENERIIFARIFDVLAKSTGSKSFTFPNPKGEELTAGFSRYHFEGVITGIAPFIDQFEPTNGAQMERLKKELIKCRLSADFIAQSRGGGRNSPGPAKKRADFIAEAVKRAL